MAEGSPPVPSLRCDWLRVPALVARLAAVALAAGWLVYEWHRWPNGTALLGPLGLVWYNGPTLDNLACCAVGLLVLAYPVRPGLPTALISVIGLLVWVFLGAAAHGIGC